MFEALQPKNVGRELSPRFTNVAWSGIAGKEVPFSIVALRERSYVATRDVPLGQLFISALESIANITST